ncbi:ECF transporter S component [Bifidobacterium tsurumiense]|nr:ECF transporter S component [Bifidobacterium tsurumiense]MDY4678798.1 ECF transporter S component [Bifidobacterium tsurumiense]MSS12060.1 ECF transporter S component [Bifidobacterium tsurumiense]
MPKNRRRPSALQAHSTGVADSGRWSSRRIAVYALFVALTAATSFIEVPLLVPWLKYDPSGIIALVAGFAFGPSAAGIVSVLSFTPHLFTNPLGAIMGMAVGLALTVPAALIYQRFRTRKGALFALIIGSICAIVIAIAGNLVITPIYTGMTVAQVAALIVPVLLPFNVLKMFLHIVCTFIIYKPISDLLHR